MQICSRKAIINFTHLIKTLVDLKRFKRQENANFIKESVNL